MQSGVVSPHTGDVGEGCSCMCHDRELGL
jgi:hypothetical protein